jgi:hypothetical protein
MPDSISGFLKINCTGAEIMDCLLIMASQSRTPHLTPSPSWIPQIANGYKFIVMLTVKKITISVNSLSTLVYKLNCTETA